MCLLGMNESHDAVVKRDLKRSVDYYESVSESQEAFRTHLGAFTPPLTADLCSGSDLLGELITE